MTTPDSSRSLRSKETIRQGWTERAGARGRWHAKNVVHTRALTEALLEAARIGPGMQVLDVASGTGDPAIAEAEMVGPLGYVTATDLVQEMLVAAETEARKAGVSNITFKQADAESLPFSDESFDAVTCRLGVMFFTNPVRALGEMLRVLKPGGRAALVAWGPPEQNLRTASTTGVLRMFLPESPGGEGGSGADRFSRASTLTAVRVEAGFQGVWAECRTVPIPWPGPVEECWDRMRDGSGGAQLVERIALERRDEAVAQVLATLQQYNDGRQVNLRADIVVGAGVR